MAAPEHFVTGEETALVHWLNGGDVVPTGPGRDPWSVVWRVRPTWSTTRNPRPPGGRSTASVPVEFRAPRHAGGAGDRCSCSVMSPDGSLRVVEAAIGTPLESHRRCSRWHARSDAARLDRGLFRVLADRRRGHDRSLQQRRARSVWRQRRLRSDRATALRRLRLV